MVRDAYWVLQRAGAKHAVVRSHGSTQVGQVEQTEKEARSRAMEKELLRGMLPIKTLSYPEGNQATQYSYLELD
jgi:hypothetical protein